MDASVGMQMQCHADAIARANAGKCMSANVHGGNTSKSSATRGTYTSADANWDLRNTVSGEVDPGAMYGEIPEAMTGGKAMRAWEESPHNDLPPPPSKPMMEGGRVETNWDKTEFEKGHFRTT